MIVIGILRCGILSETFPCGIIIVIDPVPFPFVAFYPKMVVRFHSKTAVAVARFQTCLCQNNTGRYAVAVHLCYGNILVTCYVLFTG